MDWDEDAQSYVRIETPEVGSSGRQFLHVALASAHDESRQFVESVHAERRTGQQERQRQEHEQHDGYRRIQEQVIGQRFATGA